MIADFECPKCGETIDTEFFHTYSHFLKERNNIKCSKCNTVMERQFGSYHVSGGGEVFGYEKENQDHLTLGKAFDMKQRWV